jgi:GTP-binding protein
MLNVYELPLVRGAPYAVAPAEGQPPDVDQPRTAHRALYLLDLPGYGYARASQTELRAFRLLITHVLDRARLVGVLWLLDIRREPSDDDWAMQQLFAERATPVLAALTKSDAVSRTARARRAGELRGALELEVDQMIVTSAREKEGIEELREAIVGLIQPRTP